MLNKLERQRLQGILVGFKKAQTYLNQDKVVVAHREPLHPTLKPLGNAYRDCPMEPGYTLTVFDKHIGSYIAQLHMQIYELEEFLKSE